MTLTEIEYNPFVKTHLDLLLYAGQKGKIIKTKMNFKKFTDTDVLVKLECRDFLLENKKILDDYITLNSDKLTAGQIEILLGFKKKQLQVRLLFLNVSPTMLFLLTPKTISFMQ
jgi:hypothetical protein